MDPFPDFGLFELLAASGAAALAKRIYLHQWAAVLFLVVSLIAPLALIFAAHGELARWLAAICLTTALVNAGLIFSLMRDGRLFNADR
ncbi:MAG: hypothetical protein M3380_17810 [Chloroflexota bacterium]|nr:hypothetical protein [Chloroflexota bacterium]